MSQAPAPADSPDPSTSAAPASGVSSVVPPRLGVIWQTLATVPPEKLALTFVIMLGATMMLPFIGSVGFYDPWETHYSEVAREMVTRDDYVHPHWKDTYFFSKPVLLFWILAIGF